LSPSPSPLLSPSPVSVPSFASDPTSSERHPSSSSAAIENVMVRARPSESMAHYDRRSRAFASGTVCTPRCEQRDPWQKAATMLRTLALHTTGLLTLCALATACNDVGSDGDTNATESGPTESGDTSLETESGDSLDTETDTETDTADTQSDEQEA